MTDEEMVAVVQDILDSWSAENWERVASLFAPDGEFLALYEQADDMAKAVAVFV